LDKKLALMIIIHFGQKKLNLNSNNYIIIMKPFLCFRYFQFVANPDGYEFSMTDGQQDWTRTLSNNLNPDCVGSDLKRNWAVGWKKLNEAACNSAGSDQWFGDFAFSEVEINHVADFFKK